MKIPMRSGIEATNSRYIHMTGARRLRYRGNERVSFAGITKALGINLFRTTKHVKEIGKLLEYQRNFGVKWLGNNFKHLLKTAEMILTNFFRPNYEKTGYLVNYSNY